jgi:hypothetical protein
LQVVYEDSDYEELTKREVVSLRWPDQVPASKIANCKKHAKKLGYSVEVNIGGGPTDEASAKSNSIGIVAPLDLTDSIGSDPPGRILGKDEGSGSNSSTSSSASKKNSSKRVMPTSGLLGDDDVEDGPRPKKRRSALEVPDIDGLPVIPDHPTGKFLTLNVFVSSRERN